MSRPQPLNETARKAMKGNLSKDTKPEKQFRKLLQEVGLKGYRLNWKGAKGKPDIAFVGKKIAIFINGCFWHRCSICNPKTPINNVEYWQAKFSANLIRDKRNIEALIAVGWSVFIVWECQIKSGCNNIIDEIKAVFSNGVK